MQVNRDKDGKIRIEMQWAVDGHTERLKMVNGNYYDWIMISDEVAEKLMIELQNILLDAGLAKMMKPQP